MAKAKTSTQLMEEFLAKGGKVQKLPYNPKAENDANPTISNISYKPPELHTLPDAALLYGEKSKRKKKEKVTDLSGINKDLIPASLHGLFDQEGQKSGDAKDKESHEADTNQKGAGLSTKG